MKMKKACLFIFSCVLPGIMILFPGALSAGKSGASFLKIAPGARAAGMGSAYTAFADDATAIYWNAGGLADVKRREVTGMHAEWLAGMDYDFLAYAHPTRFGTIAGSFAVLNSGNIESRDAEGNKGYDFVARDIAVSCAYARQVRDNTSMGISIKYLSQQIESEKAVGMAVDLAGKSRLAAYPVFIGYGVYNLGPRMKFLSESYDLPLAYALGAGYYIGALAVGLTVQREHHTGLTNISLGTEYQVLDTFSFRFGYAKASDKDNSSGIKDIRGGFGMKLFGNQFDYALVPYGELGSTHRISFSSSF